MVHVATEQCNPSGCPPPAAHRTRCPQCGTPSAWGVVCGPCLDTMIAADKTVRNVCPSCKQYSAFGSICDTCLAGFTKPPAALDRTIQAGDVQLLLYAAETAPAGMCELFMYIGPDSVDASDVLSDSEYLTMVRRFAAHLYAYADGFEAALTSAYIA